ncbi:DsbA family protein [Streptomyces sp. NPDC049954]|uniref:DsbA family oxidoreductase n=1 Tax=Streptomyces sp. NPDC049954 TaxID=3155779 RepID=UPI00343B5179
MTVTEFTDPACPWAWGTEPSCRLLRQTLGARCHWRQVFGILFDEDEDPAPDPDAEARWYEGFIREVTAHTDAPRPHRLRRLTRSSWPASLAAKAAQAQGELVAGRVLRRLRESTFVLGAPADSPDSVLRTVSGVPGLDPERLRRDLATPAVREAVRADWARTRDPLPEVLGLKGPGPHPGRAKELETGRRYALPTLLFEGPGGRVCVPGWRPPEVYLDAAARAAGGPLPQPLTLAPDAALERWRTLTMPELRLLTGAATPPSAGVRVDTANGPLWAHPEEAQHCLTGTADPLDSDTGEEPAGERGLGQ